MTQEPKWVITLPEISREDTEGLALLDLTMNVLEEVASERHLRYLMTEGDEHNVPLSHWSSMIDSTTDEIVLSIKYLEFLAQHAENMQEEVWKEHANATADQVRQAFIRLAGMCVTAVEYMDAAASRTVTVDNEEITPLTLEGDV